MAWMPFAVANWLWTLNDPVAVVSVPRSGEGRSLVAPPVEPKTLALVACSPERDGIFFISFQFRLVFRNTHFVQSPSDVVTARDASHPLGSKVKVQAASLFCALIYMDTSRISPFLNVHTMKRPYEVRCKRIPTYLGATNGFPGFTQCMTIPPLLLNLTTLWCPFLKKTFMFASIVLLNSCFIPSPLSKKPCNCLRPSSFSTSYCKNI